MESLENLAEEIGSIEERVADVIFEAVRAQLAGENDGAMELERQLSKVRRSLQKAQGILRAMSDER